MRGIQIPVLAIFGERDTQIDSVQGADGYRKVLQEAENSYYEVRTIPEVDHNMRLSPTSCIRVQRNGYQEVGGPKTPPEFYEVIADWLEGLKAHLAGK
jgi:hypothetical protein